MRSWLLPGEQMIVVSRPHARVLFGSALAVILLPTVLGLVSAWFSRARWSSGAEPWRVPVWVALLILAGVLILLYPVRRYLQWLSTKIILTSRRIVVRQGILSRKHRDVPLSSLRALDARQRLLQRISHSGNITLVSGMNETIIVREVPEVMAFKSLVLDAIAELPHSVLDSVGINETELNGSEWVSQQVGLSQSGQSSRHHHGQEQHGHPRN
ncbi:PH domain-containing protein [Psychromicrobium lacuslunae]|uniref:PH domain-containing protein n=1 Tax=Psychromicrobium lacuslunae TaxID=1618207 RepID=UPI0006985B9C|nr:PH domain-containing protein [Psychromicrobium lacuslunae]